MTLRQYLFIMAFATTLCWSSWIFVLYRIDPFTANALSFAFFYFSLFLAMLGSISLVLFVGFYYLSRSAAPMYRYVQRSFRSAIVVSLIAVFLLLLQGIRVLALWNIIIFACFVIIAGSLYFSMRYAPKDREL